jgi:hypothetical protein
MNQTNYQIQLNAQLNRFSGTEQYYRHLSGYHYTDGVCFLAQEYATHWLITEILVANHPRQLGEFQVWKLERVYINPQMPTDAFTLTCEVGDRNLIWQKKIPSSNFSADYVELWFTNGILYLPSEH